MSAGLLFLQLGSSLFFFFRALGNQPENGLPTRKSYWLFFPNGIALAGNSGHPRVNRFYICAPGSLKKAWRLGSGAVSLHFRAVSEVLRRQRVSGQHPSGVLRGLFTGLEGELERVLQRLSLCNFSVSQSPPYSILHLGPSPLERVPVPRRPHSASFL